MKEEWRIIPSFPDYEASDRGKIRRRITVRMFKAGAPINPSLGHNGYLHAALRRDGKSYTKRWHRMIAEAFIPNPDGKLEINHKDGNKGNNRPDNLEWVTRLENAQHAVCNGLSARGKTISLVHGRRKLDPRAVLEIRDLYKKSHISQKTLGELFGICQAQVGRIIRGTRWGCLL